MFRQRLITALILIPLVLLTLFYASLSVLSVIIGLIILACGWEWLRLIPSQTNASKGLFLILLVLAFVVCGFIFIPWMILGLMLWLCVFIAEKTYPTSKKYWGYPSVVAGLGLYLLPLAGQSMVHIFMQAQGKVILVYMLMLIWSADIGAYFAGKGWGKHKLIPLVSPGKSWEGVGGGLLLALITTSAGYVYFRPDKPIFWVILTILVVMVSIVGDLFISMLKRRVELKDTGGILPGHGGILDRLDSLIAVAPVFYCLLMMFSFGL